MFIVKLKNKLTDKILKNNTMILILAPDNVHFCKKYSDRSSRLSINSTLDVTQISGKVDSEAPRYQLYQVKVCQGNFC